jgi:hypothetical protein
MSSRRTIFLPALLFAATILAQSTDNDLPNLSTITGTAATPASTATTAASTTAASDASTTQTNAASSTGPSTTISGLISNAPTIAGVVTSIPSLIIPDLSGAPFMQKSNLPEGTVFICVGAVLGFLGACVLGWRLIVAWSINRSAQRAASTQYTSEKSRNGGYAPTYSDNNMSLEALTSLNTGYEGARDRSTQRYSSMPKPKVQQKRTPTTSSLFFSPTAGAGANTIGNRVSSYLPAGYYASGAAAPAGGSSLAHIGGPPAAGYGRIDSPRETPPTTPGLRPSPGSRNPSTDLTRDYLTARPVGRDPAQRTPSAVLDSWFDHSTAMGRTE